MMPFPPRGFTAKSDFTVFFFLEGLCTARGILIYPFNNKAFTFYSISPKIKSLNCSFFAHCPYTLVGTMFAQSDTQRNTVTWKKQSTDSLVAASAPFYASCGLGHSAGCHSTPQRCPLQRCPLPSPGVHTQSGDI